MLIFLIRKMLDFDNKTKKMCVLMAYTRGRGDLSLKGGIKGKESLAENLLDPNIYTLISWIIQDLKIPVLLLSSIQGVGSRSWFTSLGYFGGWFRRCEKVSQRFHIPLKEATNISVMEDQSAKSRNRFETRQKSAHL